MNTTHVIAGLHEFDRQRSAWVSKQRWIRYELGELVCMLHSDEQLGIMWYCDDMLHMHFTTKFASRRVDR